MIIWKMFFSAIVLSVMMFLPRMMADPKPAAMMCLAGAMAEPKPKDVHIHLHNLGTYYYILARVVVFQSVTILQSTSKSTTT